MTEMDSKSPTLYIIRSTIVACQTVDGQRALSFQEALQIYRRMRQNPNRERAVVYRACGVNDVSRDFERLIDENDEDR